VTVRAVQVVTEVAPVDRPFDYAVTESTIVADVGDRVRVDFNHRSVRGWVTGDATWSEELKPLTKWLGFGPPPPLMSLLSWASERWYSPLSRFLISTSPKRLITSLPSAPASRPLASQVLSGSRHVASGVWELAPTTDPLSLVLGAYQQAFERDGSFLVLVPTEAWANRLRGRLEQRGLDVASGDVQWDRMRAGWPVVVGPRGTALAPVPRVAGAFVIDADDESYRSTGAPTWDAVTMLRERCRRDDAPLWCTSMIPSPMLLNRGSYQKDGDLLGGWPRVDVVDRRQSDPHDGVLSRDAVDAAHRALKGDESVAVAVVLQRLGTGRLFACRKCGELARCAVCQQAEEEFGELLACHERHQPRANFCFTCGATNLKRVRVGVTTLARDVAAQLSQPVTELTATSDPSMKLERIVVGTEAIWQRIRKCSLVIFVDFDQYLLAPRASSRRSAIIAVGKAGRLVGARREGRGSVVLQTRRGDDQVLSALERGEFDDIITEDVATYEALGLAPYGAIAEISGEGAAEFVQVLATSTVSVHTTPTGYEVRAPDNETLSTALRAARRPFAKFRVAVQ
jgi:primosomal protein N' (replication factor Y)